MPRVRSHVGVHTAAASPEDYVLAPFATLGPADSVQIISFSAKSPDASPEESVVLQDESKAIQGGIILCSYATGEQLIVPPSDYPLELPLGQKPILTYTASGTTVAWAMRYRIQSYY